MQGPATHPRFDAERLVVEYHETRNVALREKIVEAYLYVASIVARRFSGRGVDMDDLYQVASLALFKAIDRFDPSRGIRFVSFATPAMVGEVKNYFRDRSRIIRLPRTASDTIREFERSREKLIGEKHREPKLDEIAEDMGVSLERAIEALEMHAATSPISMDALPLDGDSAAPLTTFLGTDEAGYREFELSDLLARASRALNERQSEVIRLRFHENLSQREAADRLGISQMSVSRIERKSLDLLREALITEEEKK